MSRDLTIDAWGSMIECMGRMAEAELQNAELVRLICRRSTTGEERAALRVKMACVRDEFRAARRALKSACAQYAANADDGAEPARPEVVDGATPELYAVWSHEHGAWWGPGETGYCREFPELGTYSRAAALQICARASCVRPDGPYNELPVRLADLVDMRRQINAGLRGAPG